MAGGQVSSNKVIIPRGEVVTDLKNRRWIVGASLDVDGSRDIYAVARFDNNELENYPAMMIFKPQGSDPQTAAMQAHICNPKTIEKWKTSKGIRHLGVTPILGVGSYKCNDEMRPYIITQRYTKNNLQQLLASNDTGFILPTVYRLIGQMFYAVEYIHNLGYHNKFIISSDKLLQSFSNPNDIYLDLIDYGKTPECLTYKSGKFQAGSPYADLESVLYNAFGWLKLPLPWQNDSRDEALVNKKKIKAFAHVDRFLRLVFGKFGVLNPIRHIMLQLASSDTTKEPDYKKFLTIIAEGTRNLKNIQHNLDSSLNFNEQLKLRRINKLLWQHIHSSSEDSSDEKDSKDFKKTIDAKGNVENSQKKAVSTAEAKTSNTVTNNSNTTTQNPSPILSFGKKIAKTAQNVTTPSGATTTSTSGVERLKMTEPSKNTANEVTQEEKPKETESQNEQQRTIPKSVSDVGANASSNIQPGKNIATTDGIGSCNCKVGVVNDRVNDDSLQGPKVANSVQSPSGSKSQSERNLDRALEDEPHKKENKTCNCYVKVEVIDVSSGDEVSAIGKSNLKVEKSEKKSKKESLENKKDAADSNEDSKSKNKIKAESSKETRDKSQNKSSDSEDSDSDASKKKIREKSLKKKKKLSEKKKKEKDDCSDSDSSDSDDNSSDANAGGKSKSNKKKRKKHRSTSSNSGDTYSNCEKKRVKRKKSKKRMKGSDSDLSPVRDSTRKESRSKRSSKRRQDRDSDLSPSRHSRRKDSRSRTSSKRRKDGDRDLSPRRSSENKNESSSRNRKSSPSKYPECFSRPRHNSYNTKSYNYSGFDDSRYQSDSNPLKQKVSHNYSRDSNYYQPSLSFGQASNNTQFRYNNNNYRLYDSRSSYQNYHGRGNHYTRFRTPYTRGGFSQSGTGRMSLNDHETRPVQRWNSFPRSDGRSTSPASSASSNLIEQKQTRDGKYGQEESQLRYANEEENGFGQVPTVSEYRRRIFEHNLTDDREGHKERDGTKDLNRAEDRDAILKKDLPDVSKSAARHTAEDIFANIREDEVNREQREPGETKFE